MTRKSNALWKQIKRARSIYLFVIPALIFYIVFSYYPMYFLQIAFRDFRITRTVNAANWVGFKYFEQLFAASGFWSALRNTLSISAGKLVFGFPLPIIMALLLNEVKQNKAKHIYQTVIYLPHFISWVVIAGILYNLTRMPEGLFNRIAVMFGGKASVIMGNKKLFQPILIISEIWKETGWGTIVYLAALTEISADLYEAARIDGANRFQQMIYVTLPGLRSIIVTMLIMRLGNILNVGFEQVMALQNDMVLSVGDTLDTYVWRVGLKDVRYSYATAAGLFKGVVAAIMIFASDRICKAMGENGLF